MRFQDARRIVSSNLSYNSVQMALKFHERKSDADLIDAVFVVREALAVAVEVAQIAVKSAVKDRKAVVQLDCAAVTAVKMQIISPQSAKSLLAEGV